jgi:hypothetical protein
MTIRIFIKNDDDTRRAFVRLEGVEDRFESSVAPDEVGVFHIYEGRTLKVGETQACLDGRVPPVSDALARSMYEAYTASSGGKNFRGDPCPAWPELPGAIHTHWQAVADLARGAGAR